MRGNIDTKSEAQKGNITPEMEAVAHDENINVNKLAKLIADGRVVIPKTSTAIQKPAELVMALKPKSMQTSVLQVKLMILNWK